MLEGPEMPIGLSSHSITEVTDDISIITGGCIDDPFECLSKKTWLVFLRYAGNVHRYVRNWSNLLSYCPCYLKENNNKTFFFG